MMSMDKSASEQSSHGPDDTAGEWIGPVPTPSDYMALINVIECLMRAATLSDLAYGCEGSQTVQQASIMLEEFSARFPPMKQMKFDQTAADWHEYVGELSSTDSDQYGVPCVVSLNNESADEIIAYCRKIGAIFHEDGPDDECFVVWMRKEIGPELWTERSLRGSRTPAVTPDPETR